MVVDEVLLEYRWCAVCVLHCLELRWSMGSGVFGSGVNGTGLCACVMELYIIN